MLPPTFCKVCITVLPRSTLALNFSPWALFFAPTPPTPLIWQDVNPPNTDAQEFAVLIVAADLQKHTF